MKRYQLFTKFLKWFCLEIKYSKVKTIIRFFRFKKREEEVKVM